MSKVAVVDSSSLLRVLLDLSALQQKGSTSVVVGIAVYEDSIQFTVSSGVAYTAKIPAQETVPMNITTLYTPMEEFIDEDCVISIEIQDRHVVFTSQNFRMSLDSAYSTVEPLKMPEGCEWSKIQDFKSAAAGLKTLLSTGLANYYKREQPVSIYGSVSAVSYPNIRMQARTIGLPFSASMSAEHCKLMLHFKPDEFCIRDERIYFRKPQSVLVLPYRFVTSENTIPKIVSDMSAPITLQRGNYTEKVKALARLKFLRVSIVVYRNGIVTQSFGKSTLLSIPVGMPSGVPVDTFIVPTDLWYLCLRLLKSDTFQILHNKEGLLCLRTQAETIVLRAVC